MLGILYDQVFTFFSLERLQRCRLFCITSILAFAFGTVRLCLACIFDGSPHVNFSCCNIRGMFHLPIGGAIRWKKCLRNNPIRWTILCFINYVFVLIKIYSTICFAICTIIAVPKFFTWFPIKFRLSECATPSYSSAFPSRLP